MRSHRERAVDQVGVAKLIESPKPQTGKIEKKPHWLQSQNAYQYQLITTPAPHAFNVVLRCETHA